MTSFDRTARYVIADALSRRHEELSGEASPIDFDGSAQIMKALDDAHFVIMRKTPTEEPSTFTDEVTLAALRGFNKRMGYSQLERMRDALEAVMGYLSPPVMNHQVSRRVKETGENQ